MFILKNLSISFSLVLGLSMFSQAKALSAPYHIKKIKSGYQVSGLPSELIRDFSQLPEDEEIALSLVDPRYGISKIIGYGRVLSSTSMTFISTQKFLFHPDLNRTYVVFELKSPPAQGGKCSGCTLTNRNLKARTPQICWCFSKLTSLGGSSDSCGKKGDRIRFPFPPESAYKLRQAAQEPNRVGDVYQECYPSSGPGGEDCTVFLGICERVGGGSSSLPGGGYGCQVK